jgi:hypothetical protein
MVGLLWRHLLQNGDEAAPVPNSLVGALKGKILHTPGITIPFQSPHASHEAIACLRVLSRTPQFQFSKQSMKTIIPDLQMRQVPRHSLYTSTTQQKQCQ